VGASRGPGHDVREVQVNSVGRAEEEAAKRGVMAKRKPAMSRDERAVYERLSEWAKQVDALTRLYTDQGQIPRNRLEEARTNYRDIKEGLRVEYKRGDTQRGAAAQTPAERRWYQSTIHEAYAGLRAPVTSSPEKWFDGLYSAYSDLRHTLSEMKRVYDIAED
jgi:hypothetical protein